MSLTEVHWPCGCGVTDIAESPGTRWKLVYCPLHGAAEKLRDALVGLSSITSTCWCHDLGCVDSRNEYSHSAACKNASAALASARVTPEATEASKT